MPGTSRPATAPFITLVGATAADDPGTVSPLRRG